MGDEGYTFVLELERPHNGIHEVVYPRCSDRTSARPNWHDDEAGIMAQEDPSESSDWVTNPMMDFSIEHCTRG